MKSLPEIEVFTDSEMEKISDMVLLQPKKESQLPIVDMR